MRIFIELVAKITRKAFARYQITRISKRFAVKLYERRDAITMAAGDASNWQIERNHRLKRDTKSDFDGTNFAR